MSSEKIRKADLRILSARVFAARLSRGPLLALRWHHPKRSRFSGGANDPRYDAVCHGRSLGPLVKTRALRDDALRDSELSFPTTIFPASFTAILIPPKMNFRVQYSYDRTDHLALPH